MPSVTFDGRSLLLDGRRLWIVGGSIHYARLPREVWADRIRAARHAGLNTIETPVVWARHEPRPGQFDFTGENDLRAFVRMVGEARMHCILRPGPYVGSAYDLGGMPPWLTSLPGLRLRTQNGPFLEACSRFITALAKQVADLQVTSSGRGGPLLMIQNEHAWTCGHDDLANAYLGELLRYYREAGFSVPVINANNLWQSVEGEIECWSGRDEMLSAVRQLGVVRPRNPRLVIDLRIGDAAAWGQAAPDTLTTPAILRSAAQVLAAGGQFVLDPFAGGTNFGFSGGRLHTTHEAFVTASHDQGAPVSESGESSDSGRALRRLCTFVSQFSRVFANLDPDQRPVLLDPAAIPGHGLGMSVAHVQGAHGGLAFVFDDPPSRSRALRYAHVVLSDGSPIAVPLSAQGVAWCLLGTRIGARSEVDYCALNAFASFGRALVCFGPEGSRGVVSVNGSPLEVETPRGRSAEPLVIEHEGVVLIVLNEEQADRTLVLDDAIIFGVSGMDAAGQPVPAPGPRHMTRIDGEGLTERIKVAPAPGGDAPLRPVLRRLGGRPRRRLRRGHQPALCRHCRAGRPDAPWRTLRLRLVPPHLPLVEGQACEGRLPARGRSPPPLPRRRIAGHHRRRTRRGPQPCPPAPQGRAHARRPRRQPRQARGRGAPRRAEGPLRARLGNDELPLGEDETQRGVARRADVVPHAAVGGATG
ncbi:MAG: beta-galactosidase [Phycisphaeraceae bacterium]|nr:beta-galactosidase [Phycisphaeraceae bacterium]